MKNDAHDEYSFYYGLTEQSIKERLRKYIKSFNYRRSQNKTELAEYIWALIHLNKTPMIKWKIVQVVNSKVKLNFKRNVLHHQLGILGKFRKDSKD